LHKAIEINKDHIKLLKDHRVFTGWYPSFKDYENDINGTGWLKVGSKLIFRNKIEIEPYSSIYVSPYYGGKGTMPSHGLCSIGTQSYSHSPLPEKMIVGRYCSIGDGLKILDSHHPVNFVSTSHFTWRPRSMMVEAARLDQGIDSYETPRFNINSNKHFPVIGHDVWVGQSVTLSMGVTVGNGAVIAANSMVTKSVPDFAIVGGNPAKVIKYRFTEYQRNELKKIKWWDYLFTDFNSFDLTDLFSFIRQWRDLGISLKKYSPKKLMLPDDLL
jgi:virginiamycin A acetyltransferase